MVSILKELDVRPVIEFMMKFSIFTKKYQKLIPKKFVRFSNFLRFRNGNCRFFQKMVLQKLEKIKIKLLSLVEKKS